MNASILMFLFTIKKELLFLMKRKEIKLPTNQYASNYLVDRFTMKADYLQCKQTWENSKQEV